MKHGPAAQPKRLNIMQNMAMINSSNLFNVTFLINLPGRPDRLRSAKRQFARVNWQIGPNDVQLFPALRFAEAAGFANAQTRGCFLSHLQCLRLAKTTARESILIMEDDIGLPRSLPCIIQVIKSRLKSDTWDFLYFGHYGTGKVRCANKKTRGSEVEFRPWSRHILGAHFYAISGRILPRLIAHLEKIADGPPGDQKYGPMPIDGAYNIFREINPDVRCLIVTPKLGWQTSSRSDLSPRFLDRWRFLHPVGDLLRGVKGTWTYWRS